VTWAGQNGELPDLVDYDSTDEELLTLAAEAVTTGSSPGIDAEHLKPIPGKRHERNKDPEVL